MTASESATFKACVACHALIESSAKFCCFCGIEQNTDIKPDAYTCPNCKEVTDGAGVKFCPACGYQAGTPVPEPVPVQAAVTVPAPVLIKVIPQSSTGSDVYVPRHGKHSGQVRKVDRVTTGILSLILGSVGAHWFYAGKPGLGVLCIFTAWTGIPALAGFIFGIITLTSDDAKFKSMIMW